MRIWYAAGLIAAVVVGRLGAALNLSGHSPVGVLSLGIGITLGALLHTVPHTQRAAGRTRLIVATVLLSLLTILAQHAWLYHSFRQQWHRARVESAEAAMFRPESPWSPREYFMRELTPQRAALWCADALLITVAAVGTVVLLDRKRQ